MSGKGIQEFKRVFIKDSASDVKSESDAIAAINKAKAKSVATESVGNATNTGATPTESSKPETPQEPTPGTIALTQDQLSVVVQNAIASALKPYEEKLAEAQRAVDTVRQQAEQDKAATEAELNRTKTERDKLADVFKLMGNPNPVQMPSVNTITRVNSDTPQGTVAEFLQTRDRAPRVQKMTASGAVYVSYDSAQLNHYVKQHKQQLVRDLESWGKAQGLLQGRGRISTDAITTIGNIPGGFLDVLSAIMRSNNRPGFIFWQFPVTRINFDKGLGDNVQIPRAAFLPAIANPDARKLSGGGTFVTINSNNQNIQTGVVNAEIEEWGLGRDSTSPPVGIPAFVQAYSMIDLMAILDRNLWYDYYSWEDVKIRSLWTPTSRVVYNKNGAVVETATALLAGDDGTLTEAFMNALYGYMRSAQIPTYMDGCYGLAVNSLSVTQFKNDLGEKFAPASDANLRDLTNILNPVQIGSDEVDKVTGYVGKYCNFHIFDSNSFGCGASGTEGVHTETLGGTSVTTRSSYAFGADTIGRGIGTEVEIRKDTNDDFQRLNRFIWRAEEGYCQLDVCPDPADTTPVPQQLRVIEVRVSDRKV